MLNALDQAERIGTLLHGLGYVAWTAGCVSGGWTLLVASAALDGRPARPD